MLQRRNKCNVTIAYRSAAVIADNIWHDRLRHVMSFYGRMKIIDLYLYVYHNRVHGVRHQFVCMRLLQLLSICGASESTKNVS